MVTNKIKICIPERTNLFEPILEEAFERVGNPNEADFIIAQSTINPNWDFSKVIYIAIEPPLADHRLFCYSNFDKFHTVITHNPNSENDNEFPFTKNDEVQFYPTRADPYPFVTREDTIIGERGVFYAGMIGFYESAPDKFGGINITALRSILGNYFNKEFPASKIIGNGWNGQVVKVGNWREDKLVQIEKSKCDFVLALENTIYPNYLYEKIWDGITADRVTLYLGDPNVHRHIPLNCFIDLRPYFDSEKREIDLDGIGKKLETITQKEYDSILKNAREFRLTSEDKHISLMKELAEFLVRRIKDNVKEFK